MTRADRLVSRGLSSLQAGRAVAAILVVLFHNSTRIFALPKYWEAKPFGRLFDFGDSGVFFFFVLSGFIIFHAHHRDLDRPEKVRDYAWKRFRRIYPIYWVVLLLALFLYLLVGNYSLGYETHPEIILSSVLLVHFGSLDKVVPVSWTLFHEILFYAVFALMIWRMRLGLTILGVWLALSAMSMATDHGSMLTAFYFSHLHLLFGFGMAASWWIRRRSVPLPATTVLLGTALYLLAGVDEISWNQMSDDWRTLAFGLGSMLILLGLVELENAARLKVPAWLRLLGDASYSIYLVHYFVLSFLAKLAWASGAARLMPVMAAFVLVTCLAVAAGVLCHLVVERPLLALLGRQSMNARRLPA